MFHHIFLKMRPRESNSDNGTEISCAIHYTKDALYFYFSAFIKKIKIICQFYLKSTNTDDANLFPSSPLPHLLS